MLNLVRVHIILLVLLAWLSLPMFAADSETTFYNCELGLQAGLGYYTGDAARLFGKWDENSLRYVREAYGAVARYKFDERWALRLKGQRQRIAYSYGDTKYNHPTWNVDIAAEFNFFRLGMNPYVAGLKRISPFIFLGVGTNIANGQATIEGEEATYKIQSPYKLGVYFPLGIGVKWIFARRWQLQAAWQYQVHLFSKLGNSNKFMSGDAVEGLSDLNNPYEMNGSNFMNNDLTSSLTIGIVYEFGENQYRRYSHEPTGRAAQGRVGGAIGKDYRRNK